MNIQNLGETLKAIDCLNYQSCEGPDYEKSESKEIQNILKDFLFNKMKYQFHEYEEAPWGID